MIQLIRRQIFPETMEILYDKEFTTENLTENFEIKGGKWYVDEEGWLVGENRENSAAMVISKDDYFGDVLLEFDAATILPARFASISMPRFWNPAPMISTACGAAAGTKKQTRETLLT